MTKKKVSPWGDWTPQTDYRSGATYNWVPAATEYSKRGGVHIYVRYERGPDKVTLVDHDSDFMRIRCPDRELLLVANGQRAHIYRPMQGTYDEFYNLSPFWEHSSADLDYGCIMTNYTSYIGKEQRSSGIRRGPFRHEHGTKVIADSGGFQLFKGTIDYIDPKSLVSWYNDNADWGMVLDTPISTPGIDIHKRSAKVQARNTQIMLDNKADHVSLLNIIHGAAGAEMDAFRKIVERPDIDRLAVGGIYFGSILSSINRFCDVISGGQPYKHVHALGVANITQTIPLMRLSGDVIPLITSDSSSHLQAANGRKYYKPNGLDSMPTVAFYADSGGCHPGGNQVLECQCPVCSVLKYKDVMSMINSNTITLMLVYHNMFTIQNFQKILYDRVAHTPVSEAKDALRQLYGASKGKRKQMAEFFHTLDFIEVFKSDGLDIARKEFAFYLPRNLGETATKTLFAGIETEETEGHKAKDLALISTYEEVLNSGVVRPSTPEKKTPPPKKGKSVEGDSSELEDNLTVEAGLLTDPKLDPNKKGKAATKVGGKSMGVTRSVRPGKRKKVKKSKPKGA